MYILDPQREAAFLATLELVQTLDDGWSKRFVAPDGVEWLLHYPRGELHGGGPRVLRTRDVPSSVTAWVTACFRSEDDDDLQGLALDLSVQPEAWFEVITTLETSVFDSAKVRAVVTSLGVLAGSSRRTRRFAELRSRAGRTRGLTRRSRHA